MTITEAIEVQTLQLAKYRLTLNTQVFKALVDYCTAENTKVLDDPDGDSWDIPYGGQLEQFIDDWADDQQTSTEFIIFGYDLEQFMTTMATVEKELLGGKIVGLILNERKQVTVVAELTKAQKSECTYTLGLSKKPNWVK